MSARGPARYGQRMPRHLRRIQNIHVDVDIDSIGLGEEAIERIATKRLPLAAQVVNFDASDSVLAEQIIFERINVSKSAHDDVIS